MKLLPQKDLNLKLNDEKLQQTKQGLFLARKVDQLREEIAETQKTHDESIAGMNREYKLFSAEMASKKGQLENEIRDLEEKRIELMIPLDAERLKYNTLQKEQSEWRDKLIKDDYEILLKQVEIDEKTKSFNKLSKELEFNLFEATKKLEKVDILIKEKENEVETAKKERLEQYNEHNKKIKELSQTQNEYDTILNTLDIRSRELREKESELIIREKHLASQQVSLRNAYERIKQNATNK